MKFILEIKLGNELIVYADIRKISRENSGSIGTV